MCVVIWNADQIISDFRSKQLGFEPACVKQVIVGDAFYLSFEQIGVSPLLCWRAGTPAYTPPE